MKKTFIYLIFTSFLGLFSSLFAGEIYVSPYGSDKNAGTKEAPFYTLERAIIQAREWRRLNRPEVTGGIYIRLEDGVYIQRSSLFIRPEDSGTPDSPTVICAAESAHPVISGGGAADGAGAAVPGDRHVGDGPGNLYAAVCRGGVCAAIAAAV